jgi:hypothetical protein
MKDMNSTMEEVSSAGGATLPHQTQCAKESGPLTCHRRWPALMAVTVVSLSLLSLSFCATTSAYAQQVCAPYPPGQITISVEPSNVSPGGTVEVSACGFMPNSSVSIYLLSRKVQLGTFTANANGDVTAVVTIPKDVRPGPHIIRAIGISPNNQRLVLDAQIFVTRRHHHHHHHCDYHRCDRYGPNNHGAQDAMEPAAWNHPQTGTGTVASPQRTGLASAGASATQLAEVLGTVGAGAAGLTTILIRRRRRSDAP